LRPRQIAVRALFHACSRHNPRRRQEPPNLRLERRPGANPRPCSRAVRPCPSAGRKVV